MNQKLYTSKTPAHVRWSLTFVLSCLLIVSGFVTTKTQAQCIQTSPFGTQTLSGVVSGFATIGCNFGGEYGTWNGAVTGSTYNFTSTIGTDYLTISAAPGGPAIAFGTQPLSWVSTVTGTIYVHVSTNPACGTANSCRDITGTTTAIFVPGCTNGSAFGTGTLSGAVNGFSTIGCNFAGEYGTWNGAVTGSTYNFTSTIGTDYLTIHTGSPAGPIVAAGTQPLSWVSTVTGTIYVHVNTNSACGTANSCRDITGTTTALPVVQVLTPSTGSNSIACGTNTTLCTHAGCGVPYSNGVDGHTIINAANSAVININGTYSTESSFDFITIYAGSGTGGAVLFGPVSGAGSINYTGLPGQTLTVRFTSDGSVTSTGYNLAVTYTGSCLPPNLLVPFTGSNTNPCGTNVTLCSHAGCGVAYNNSANGSTTLLSGGTAAININGTYSTESGFDFITIYNGIGTGGTQLFGPVSGSGTINYTGLPGQILTVGFTSDGSVTSTGFSFAVTYTGLCAPPCLISATAVASPTAVCPGGVSTLTATAASNNGAVSYLWSTSETTQSISAGPGTYTVTVTDAVPAGCSASATVVVGVNATTITTAATATTICNGASSTLSASQGTSSTLIWSEELAGGVTTPAQCATWDAFRASLVPAPYTSCNMSGTFDPIGRTATTPATVQAIASALKNATLFNAVDGANTWVVGTGCGSGCGGGVVELSADGTSCSCTSPGYNVRPNLVGSNSGGVNTATCGGPTQTITVSFSSNSVGPLNTYSWAPAAGLSCTTCATPVASPSVTTTYTVTGTLSNGCTGTATITVNVISPTANCSGTNVSCIGGSNGAASVVGSGGNGGPYTFLWTNGATTSSITGLSAGTYTVFVTDAGGCTGSCSYIVTQPTAVAAIAIATDASCPLCPDGTVSISSTSGGTPGYTFTNLTGLLPGNYCITVTDNNGCTTSACATVGAAGCTLNANASVTNNVTCFGGNNGSATSTPTGGITGPLTYAWSTGSTNASISGLSAGTYTVVLTDAGSGCVNQGVVTVTQPPLLTATCSGTNPTCFGGSNGTASVTGDGGTQLPSATTVTYLMNDANTTPGFNIGCAPNTKAYATPFTGPDYGFTWTDGLSPASTITNIDLETSFHLNCNSLSPRVVNLNTLFAGLMPVNGTQCSGCNSPIAVNNGNLNAGIANYIKGGSNTIKYVLSNVNFEGFIANPAWSSSDNIYARLHVTSTNPGGGGYTYLWSTGSTNASVSGLPAGSYCVTITDANGCTATCCYTVVEPAAVTATGIITNVVCAESATGGINITPAGGTPGYTFLWSNGSTDEDQTGLSAGTYTVAITDANGCTGTYSGTVSCTDNIPPVLSVGPGSGTLISETFESGVLSPGWTGTGLWHVTTACVGSPLPDGTKWAYYGIDGTCSFNSGVTNSGTLTAPTVFIPNSASSAEIVFWKRYNGEGAPTSSFDVAQFQINGVNQAVTIGGTLFTTNGLQNGTDNLWQRVTVNATPFIGQNVTMSWFFNSVDGIGNDDLGLQIDSVALNFGNLQQCPDDIIAINDPGVCGTTVSWTPPTATDNCVVTLTSNKNPGDFFPVGTTVVTYTATDGCGNATSCSFNVTVNQVGPPILTISDTHVNADCQGTNSGSIDLTVTGGATPYGYLWSNGATTEDLSGLFVGVYTVVVTEANGCSATYIVSIGDFPPLQTSETHVNVLCGGDLTGSIDITATDGKPGYDYLWNDGNTNEDRTGLAAGTYTVTISDQCGSSQILTITITEPAALASSVVANNVTCFGACDGSIAYTITGGATPYNYVWSSGQTTSAISALCPGTYTLVVTDNNGCTISGTINITEPAQLFVTETHVNVTCFQGSDGSIDVTLVGGTPPFSYQWSNGATTEDISGLNANQYFLTVTEANGCITRINVTITSPTKILIPAVLVNPSSVNINGGSITTNVSGGVPGYTYLWSNGASTSANTGLAAGTYTVTVTDASGCLAFAIFTLKLECKLGAINTVVQNASCYKNNAIVTAAGTGGTGYTYQWQTAPVQTTATGTGLNFGFNNYVLITDIASGCSFMDTVVKPHTVSIGLAVTSPTYAGGKNIRCFGGFDGSASVAVSGDPGPFTYIWSTGATTSSIIGLPAGTYFVTVTTGSPGCTSTGAITLTQPTMLVVSTTKVNPSCGGNNGSATAAASSGVAPYSYSWNTIPVQTTITATGLAAGVYTVTVSDANGCTKTSMVTLTSAGGLTVTGVVTNVKCFGTATGSIDITPAGGNPGYTYLWSTGATTQDRINVLAVGTYTVVVTDSKGCTGQFSATIQQPALLVVTAVKTNITCNGAMNGTANVTASGGTPAYTYSWNTVPTKTTANVTGLKPGTWTCLVTDSKGCVKSVSVTITQPAILSVATSKTNVTTFGGNNGTATANPSGGIAPYSYSWNTAPVQNTQTATGLIAGTYTVTVTDANGCTKTKSVTITQPSSRLFGNDQTVEKASSLLYPNPSTGFITITFNEVVQSRVTIDIYNFTGAHVYSKRVNAESNSNSFYLDLSQLAKGIYTVKYQTGDHEWIDKLVIQ